MSIFGGNGAAPKAVLDAARKIMSGEEIEEKKKLDPVGQEDGDIDNDGDKDSSDEYLMKRRKAIKKAMKTDESVEEAVFAPCDGCPDPDKCEEAGKCLKAEEAMDVDADNVEKALKHDCATHIQHEEHGIGRCIPGMHTLEQVDEENGVVTHYDVMFENDEGPYIVENVPVEEMKVLKDMNHGHKKKK